LLEARVLTTVRLMKLCLNEELSDPIWIVDNP